MEGNWFNLMNRHSELALDGNEHQHGSYVHQWALHDQDNQKWCVISLPNQSGYLIKTIDIETNREYLLSVEVLAGQGPAQGNRVVLVQYDITISPDNFSIWTLEGIHPGWYYLVNAANSNLVLDVSGASNHNGGRVHLWPRLNRSNQMWRLAPTHIATKEGTQFPFLTPSIYTIDFSDIGDRLMPLLSEQGFAVITNVLNTEERARFEGYFGEDLFSVCDKDACISPDTHISIKDSYSLLQRSIGHERAIIDDSNSDASSAFAHVPRLWPGEYTKPGLSVSFGLSQGRFAWAARLHPRIQTIYRLMHQDSFSSSLGEDTVGENPLVVGVDGIFFKPVCTKSSRYTVLWGHADMNIHAGDINVDDCSVYQSILSIWPSDSQSDATTVVWPGSHARVFPTLMQDECSKQRRDHYIRISYLTGSGDGERAQSQLVGSAKWIDECFLREGRRLALPAGSLLVWDSRLIHQGWTEGKRLAMPICWEPRRRRSMLAFNRKIRIIASGSITTHWASFGYEHSLVFLKGRQPGREDNEYTERIRAIKPSSEIIVQSDRCFPTPNQACLPTGPFLVPDVIRPEFRDRYEDILKLCLAAKASGDNDEEIVRQLIAVLRPEVVASV